MDQISLKDACDLLRVSRVTLNVYRRKYGLTQLRWGGKLRLSKTEIIEKIILPFSGVSKDQSLTFLSGTQITGLQPLLGVYDLRRIQRIDVHGVMALLCAMKAHLKASDASSVSLLLDGSPVCSYLDALGFFREVERAHSGRVYCNYAVLQKRQLTHTAVILPLHLIGYRGAEKKILDDLYDPLLKQGFSESYCGHIGWVIGELCDNAHTHSEGPCYLMIEALESESTATRFLCIAVGDIGVGIPGSLRKNPHYAAMGDKVLLPMAFQSEVSRMEVEPKRGKGLNDVIGISKGNSSWLRVDCGSLGVRFDFEGGLNKMELVQPAGTTTGTRFSLVLIDGEFKKISRADMNDVMRDFLEKT